jgi:hypothetical protein
MFFLITDRLHEFPTKAARYSILHQRESLDLRRVIYSERFFRDHQIQSFLCKAWLLLLIIHFRHGVLPSAGNGSWLSVEEEGRKEGIESFIR